MPNEATTTVVTEDSQSIPHQSQGNGVASSTLSVPPKDALLQPAAEVSRPVKGEAPELNAPELFLNRELTWLAFNRRVFEEALDEHNPLLERVKFLAITASNLDEFFMKRIGGLKQQVVAGLQEPTVDGRTPQQQIAECYAKVAELEAERRQLVEKILARLAEH